MGQRLSKINWKLYNRELKNRGSITFWLDSESLCKWFSERSSSWGFQEIYSDLAIQLLLILRYRFHLSLRETHGFAESIFHLLGLELPIPCYSTLSRRAEQLSVEIRQKSQNRAAIHVVLDSTGLKVFGEGEWKVRQHGVSKRRTWRKLHLAVDESTGEILSSVLTDNTFKDNEVYEDLMDEINDPSQITGDGAYDAKNCWVYCEERDIHANFPPRKGAKIQQHGNCLTPRKQRDQNIRVMREIGRESWKYTSEYTRRSLAETAMYRFKELMGERLSSRNFSNQATEAFLKCKILNQMKTPAQL